ncbi:MAG: NAD(P)-dependent oxidoreductase [Cyclonatronaceae bacterium]
MKRIGWIGTGIMGAPMAGHLLGAGYELSVTTRTKARAETLLSAGAAWRDTPRAVAEASDIVFSIVGYPEDVEAVLLGENGALSGLAEGGILVDMTTSRPALAVTIADAAAKKGVKALDAPVSGGDSGAKAGTLAIMAGGDKAAYDEVLPLFERMGKNIELLGSAGAGQHTKMVNQILVASGMIGTVESLLYAASAGLDLEQVISVVGKGAAANWAVNNLGPKIAEADYNPGFFIKHFVKDLGIAMEEARRMKLALPGLATAQQFYQAAMAQGLEDFGTQALYKVYERLNGRDA